MDSADAVASSNLDNGDYSGKKIQYLSKLRQFHSHFSKLESFG